MLSAMARVVPALVAALLSALALPLAAAAHGAGQPWLLVPADHVEQGQSFTVIGADMGPGVQVTLELAAGGSITPLGSAQAAADGHFEASFVVPATIPDGYVELRARDAGGLDAATWLLVGDGTEAAPASPPTVSGSAWWADPSVIVLGALLGGAALALLVMLVRRSRAPARVHVPAGAARPRPVARKSGPRKSRRAH